MAQKQNLNSNSKILIVGAGIFGAGTAVELATRGYRDITIVDILNKGPNALAASTDISKIIRSDYGNDLEYVRLHDEAMKRWKEWNQKWGEELYHEVGLLVLSKKKMEKGTFAWDSYNTLKESGYPVERLTVEEMKQKYPKWNASGVVYNDGYVNRRAGWAQSGKVVAKRLQEAKNLGVKFIEDSMKSLITAQVNGKTKVMGITLASGKELKGDLVIVAAGAWTPILLPFLANTMVPVAQPVFHFQPKDLSILKDYVPPTFPVYGADLEETGFYGFPAHPNEKCLKIGNHGRGYPLPNQPIDKESLDKILRHVVQYEESKFRNFIKENWPAEMHDAKAVFARLCMYCDSFDGNFFIGRDPEREGLVVAAGGSGHGFKFGPVIGDIVADAVEYKETTYTKKFGWRKPTKLGFDVCRNVKEDPTRNTLKANL